MIWPRRHYFSTYCMHGQHTNCRLTCKICGKQCRCYCHRYLAELARAQRRLQSRREQFNREIAHEH